MVLVVGCGPRVNPSEVIDGSDTGGASTSSTGGPITASTTLGMTTVGTTTVGTTVADTSTSNTTTVDTSDDSSTGPGTHFVIDADGGCTALSCDVWAQDCPRGEKCVPWNAGGDGPSMGCSESRCSELAPEPRAPGESCTADGGPWSGVDDCDVGSYCWNVDELTLEGVCVAQCIGSEASPLCADDELYCFMLQGTSVTACVPVCDPLAPMCPAGSTCALSGANDQAAACVSTTLDVPSGHGTPCDWRLGCGDGFACVEATTLSACDDSYCCASLCDVDSPTCAAEDPTCMQVRDAIAGVGTCGVG